jgi:hypothetical protein
MSTTEARFTDSEERLLLVEKYMRRVVIETAGGAVILSINDPEQCDMLLDGLQIARSALWGTREYY